MSFVRLAEGIDATPPAGGLQPRVLAAIVKSATPRVVTVASPNLTTAAHRRARSRKTPTESIRFVDIA